MGAGTTRKHRTQAYVASASALALAERLRGVEQVQVLDTVILGDGATFYGVQVRDGIVDLRSLEPLEGTWVQVTRLQEQLRTGSVP